ncbi:MAG: dolichyl-phosphate beta-glucosyltransferase [Dehalococcoidia bacterium]
MENPYLSVVIPAFNEQVRIASTVNSLVEFLNVWLPKDRQWELLVVDDGSSDDTASIVSEIGVNEPRVRVINAEHGGKGSAVRRGMSEANGDWRFLCDADLSMPAEHLGRFFADDDNSPKYDISIASREAPGAVRYNEPRSRHVKGRLFNYAVKVLAMRGIEDTQCGFKLFSKDAAEKLFPKQSLEGWAFDVELLVMAKNAGYYIGEIPIDWYYGEGSKMTLTKGVLAVLDVAKVGLNNLLGKYRLERG